MASVVAGPVPVEEYLRTAYKPACEYLDGVLRQKTMATWKHSLIQGQLSALVNQTGRYRAGTELTVKIREGKFLVPDVGVQARQAVQEPYPTQPIFLCIEILTPDDRLADALAKCGEYLTWGTPMTWIVDPDSRRAWQYSGPSPEEVTASGYLATGDLRVSLSELFSVLD